MIIAAIITDDSTSQHPDGVLQLFNPTTQVVKYLMIVTKNKFTYFDKSEPEHLNDNNKIIYI